MAFSGTFKLSSQMQDYVDQTDRVAEAWKTAFMNSLPIDVINIFSKIDITDVMTFYRDKARQASKMTTNVRGDLERDLLKDLKTALKDAKFDELSYNIEFVSNRVCLFKSLMQYTSDIEAFINEKEERIIKERNRIEYHLSHFNQKKEAMISQLMFSEKPPVEAIDNLTLIYNTADLAMLTENEKDILRGHLEQCQLHDPLEVYNLILKIEQVAPKNWVDTEIAVQGTSGSHAAVCSTDNELIETVPTSLKQWVEEKSKDRRFASCQTLQAAKLLLNDIQIYLNAFQKFFEQHNPINYEVINYQELLKMKLKTMDCEDEANKTNMIELLRARSTLNEFTDEVDGLCMYGAAQWLKVLELTGEYSS